MRTVWLALFCLIGLATTVLARIISLYVSTDVSPVVPFAKAEVLREVSTTNTAALSLPNATIGTMITDPPIKEDKLDAPFTNQASPQIKVSPKTETQVSKKGKGIISRHWHDPSDQRSAQSKRKASNLNSAGAKS